MTVTRTAHTVWDGDLTEGTGTAYFDSSQIAEQSVTWASRVEQANGRTSPEELIAAAHSSCFSMALANGLTEAGTPPTQLWSQAEVTLRPGTGITGVHLTVRGTVPGIDPAGFTAAAENAKANCPVSQALTGTEITLSASLA